MKPDDAIGWGELLAGLGAGGILFFALLAIAFFSFKWWLAGEVKRVHDEKLTEHQHKLDAQLEAHKNSLAKERDKEIEAIREELRREGVNITRLHDRQWDALSNWCTAMKRLHDYLDDIFKQGDDDWEFYGATQTFEMAVFYEKMWLPIDLDAEIEAYAAAVENLPNHKTASVHPAETLKQRRDDFLIAARRVLQISAVGLRLPSP